MNADQKKSIAGPGPYSKHNLLDSRLLDHSEIEAVSLREHMM